MIEYFDSDHNAHLEKMIHLAKIQFSVYSTKGLSLLGQATKKSFIIVVIRKSIYYAICTPLITKGE